MVECNDQDVASVLSQHGIDLNDMTDIELWGAYRLALRVLECLHKEMDVRELLSTPIYEWN